MISEIAQGKAYTAALTQASTTNLGEIDALAYPDGVVQCPRLNSQKSPLPVSGADAHCLSESGHRCIAAFDSVAV